MRGRIKRFIEDKGFGFITGEDGADYFFHISQVKDIIELKNWMIVEFDVADGKKGKNAVNIRVSEQNSTSRFITFGDLNIRLSNIKEYKINRYFENYDRVFVKQIVKKEQKGFLRIKYTKKITLFKPTSEWHSEFYDYSYYDDTDKYRGKNISDICNGYYNLCYRDKDGGIQNAYLKPKDWKYVQIDRSLPVIGNLLKNKQKYCLEITTFQKDEYHFWESGVNFDVVEKYNKINNAMQYGH